MIAVDLFSGCGGLSLGFANSGVNVVAAYDNWKPAIACYGLNFDHPIFEFDLTDAIGVSDHIVKHQPKMIIGGPPCQDFSHAGKRHEGKRANLTEAFASVVKTVRPEWFVMENVDRAAKSSAYFKARKIFKSAGYGLTEKVLDASKCGVPQRRKRFFCIGHSYSKDHFLDSLIEDKISSHSLTVRQYLGDELGINYYYRHPRNYNRRGIFSIDEPAPTVRGVNRPVPKGYPGHHGDPVPVSSKIRPLTTMERARLQTFPKAFKWEGSKTDLEQMIGNAVPVNLASFVADSIMAYIGLSVQLGRQYEEIQF